MAATTTAFKSLVKRLKNDFPSLIFAPGDDFHWSAAQNTVFYPDSDIEYAPQLLHEAAHGALGHSTYSRDLDLLKLEREAWNKASELAKHYDVDMSDDTIEDSLDTYREWLHARSTCPTCGKTGVQVSPSTYNCVACLERWRTNDARTCGLRRTKI